MIRITALNEERSSESEDELTPTVTKEAQEEAAFTLYNKALKLQQEGKAGEAKQVLEELLQCPLITEASQPEEKEKLTRPAHILKYSSLKNLGVICSSEGDLQSAMENYLNALHLDDTDVTLWYKLGTAASQLVNYPLARVAFQEGLRCSPHHWPCLDNLITVQYILNDYLGCLASVCKAFELDPDYSKGHTFKERIFSEQPSLKEHVTYFLQDYESLMHKVNHVENSYHKEALSMREKHLALRRERTIPVLKCPKPVDSWSWKSIGESFISLYDHIEKSEDSINFGCKVNVQHSILIHDAVSTPDSEAVETVTVKMEVEEGKPSDHEEVTPTALKTPTTAESLTPVDTDDTGATVDLCSESDLTPDASRKGMKRKREKIFYEWLWEGKRRSSRVKGGGGGGGGSVVGGSGGGRRGEESSEDHGHYMRALSKFLPRKLQMESSDSNAGDSDVIDSSQGTMYSVNSNHINHTNSEMSRTSQTCDQYFGSTSEAEEAKDFLEECKVNLGVIDVMTRFQNKMKAKHGLVWPPELRNLYVKTYVRLRRHIRHPCPLSNDTDVEELRNDSEAALLYAELELDALHSTPQEEALLLLEDSPFPNDVNHLLMVSVRHALFGSESVRVVAGIHWLASKYFLMQGNVDGTMHSLHAILAVMSPEKSSADKPVREGTPPPAPRLDLANVFHEGSVTIERVRSKLEFLRRSQSLEEVVVLHSEGDFQAVVDILEATFQQKPFGNRGGEVSERGPNRETQLELMLDSLHQLGDHDRCFWWGESCLDEAIGNYGTSNEEKWAKLIQGILIRWDACLEEDGGRKVVDFTIEWEGRKVARLARNLVRVITCQLEAPESAIEMPFESVTPWIMLHQLIAHGEECSNNGSDKEDDDSDIPGSLMFLSTAHDYLGRRSWCLTHEGCLLLYMLEVLVPRLRSEEWSSFRDELYPMIEQATYCLYAHPSKKTKSRYLQDHGVPQIALTWERACTLFDLFRPDEMPEFDAYKVISISAEVENLLKRISALVPPQFDPANRVDRMVRYIEGSLDAIPLPPTGPGIPPTPHVIRDLYYLLGDYYFKNNEWAKAIRNYLRDVCMNPARLDSWAAMALARGSQLDTKLNSCEALRSESEFLRKAEAAIRCFERTIQIDPSHSSMLIEFGSFAYMVHSFLSRLLKQDTDTMSIEQFEQLEEKKENMLKLVHKCFTSVNNVYETLRERKAKAKNTGDEEEEDELQDERWLHHYMLGKVAEKRKANPAVCLKHYKQAAKHLAENNANYPRRISYNNPPELAVEALEVYYRSHAFILKFLEEMEEGPGKTTAMDTETRYVFEKYLREAARSAFISEHNRREGGVGAGGSNTVVMVDLEKEEEGKRKAEDDGGGGEPKKHCNEGAVLAGDSSVIESVIEIVNDLIGRVVETVDGAGQCIQSQESITTELMRGEEVMLAAGQKSEQAAATSAPEASTPPLPPVDQPKSIDDRRDSAASSTSAASSSAASSSESSGSYDSSAGTSTDSSNSDSDSSDSGTDNKDEAVEEGDHESCHSALVRQCLDALRVCLQRFPQHYKSHYRLAHYYFHSKKNRDINECRARLLGAPLLTTGVPKTLPISGLFAERRSSNFFNGVWRIPVNEIDRPGSFASHMSRCVSLLMDLLKEDKDHRLLLELALQLKKVPDAEKKYLRDTEREQLAQQAFTLCVASLRARVREAKSENPKRPSTLLDIYWTYRRIQKHLPTKEGVVATVLEEAYRDHRSKDLPAGATVTMDQVVRYCQQQNALLRTPPVPVVPTSLGVSAGLNPPSQSSVVYRRGGRGQTGRPRGRPPNISKLAQFGFPVLGKPGQLGAGMMPPFTPEYLAAMQSNLTRMPELALMLQMQQLMASQSTANMAASMATLNRLNVQSSMLSSSVDKTAKVDKAASGISGVKMPLASSTGLVKVGTSGVKMTSTEQMPTVGVKSSTAVSKVASSTEHMPTSVVKPAPNSAASGIMIATSMNKPSTSASAKVASVSSDKMTLSSGIKAAPRSSDKFASGLIKVAASGERSKVSSAPAIVKPPVVVKPPLDKTPSTKGLINKMESPPSILGLPYPLLPKRPRPMASLDQVGPEVSITPLPVRSRMMSVNNPGMKIESSTIPKPKPVMPMPRQAAPQAQVTITPSHRGGKGMSLPVSRFTPSLPSYSKGGQLSLNNEITVIKTQRPPVAPRPLPTSENCEVFAQPLPELEPNVFYKSPLPVGIPSSITITPKPASEKQAPKPKMPDEVEIITLE